MIFSSSKESHLSLGSRENQQVYLGWNTILLMCFEAGKGILAGQWPTGNQLSFSAKNCSIVLKTWSCLPRILSLENDVHYDSPKTKVEVF
jgi:hypothetical protein